MTFRRPVDEIALNHKNALERLKKYGSLFVSEVIFQRFYKFDKTFDDIFSQF
jgi:hypothetical protein